MTNARIDLRTGRLTRAHQVFGAWTSLGHSSITEIFSASGVDFVGIDLEHSTISLEEARQIMAAAHTGGVACFPRISSHNGEQIKRLLDSGADGIIVPMVCTPEEVKRLVEWCKYPPRGRRSYGVASAQDYGFSFADYTANWNKRSSLIIQIEAISAVNCIDDLVAHEDVDGAMIGPYDLSGSLGIPGQLSDPRVTEACQKVVEACRRHGKACGTQLVDVSEATIAAAFDSGFTFVILSSDVFLLWKWSESIRKLTSGFRAK
jgi:2-keto-3-deoxy-L-rhamnonate aldolase RhmA